MEYLIFFLVGYLLRIILDSFETKEIKTTKPSKVGELEVNIRAVNAQKFIDKLKEKKIKL